MELLLCSLYWGNIALDQWFKNKNIQMGFNPEMKGGLNIWKSIIVIHYIN